ncbi:MAG: hypothetical protein ACRD0M_03880 [Acidimicrobiales bacterium]
MATVDQDAGTPTGTPTASPRRRPRPAVILVGLVAAVALGVAAVTVGGKGAGLPAEGRELLALLEKGEQRTYHARYGVSSTTAGGPAPFVYEVWQKPPRIRQDTEDGLSGRVVHRATFLVDDRVVRCAQVDAGPWACEPQPGASSDDLIVSRVRALMQGQPVTARDETVVSRPARCFTFTSAGGQATELCADADGVPVRVITGGSRLDLLASDTNVADERFTLPAPA